MKLAGLIFGGMNAVLCAGILWGLFVWGLSTYKGLVAYLFSELFFSCLGFVAPEAYKTYQMWCLKEAIYLGLTTVILAEFSGRVARPSPRLEVMRKPIVIGVAIGQIGAVMLPLVAEGIPWRAWAWPITALVYGSLVSAVGFLAFDGLLTWHRVPLAPLQKWVLYGTPSLRVMFVVFVVFWARQPEAVGVVWSVRNVVELAVMATWLDAVRWPVVVAPPSTGVMRVGW